MIRKLSLIPKTLISITCIFVTCLAANKVEGKAGEQRQFIETLGVSTIKELIRDYEPAGFNFGPGYVTPEALATTTIYQLIEANVDSDDQREYVMCGGTTMEWGVGICLLFDWQGSDLQPYALGNADESFLNLQVADVNRDQKQEIIFAYRLGSDAHVTYYIYSFDGHEPKQLWGPDLTKPFGPYIHGSVDFKDSDADGIDELWIWNAIWAEDECNQCPHIFEIYVLTWDGKQYVLQHEYKTAEKYSPSSVNGRIQTLSLFGVPDDYDRNLVIEESRNELEKRRSEGSLDIQFVSQLLERSYSFWTERLYEQGGAMAQLTIEAAAELPGDKTREWATIWALYNQANNLQGHGKYQQADELYRNIISRLEVLLENGAWVDEETSNPTEVKRTLMTAWSLAGINSYTFDIQSTLYAFLQSSKLATELDNPEDTSISISNLGVGFFLVGDLARAEDSFNTAIELDKKINRPFGEMFNQRHLASIHLTQGNVEKAQTALQTALKLAMDLGDVNHVAEYHMDLGRSYFLGGDFENARLHLQQALLLTSAQGIRDRQGVIYIYLGDLYAATGEAKQASMFYRKVLNTFATDSLTSPFGVFWRAYFGLSHIAQQENRLADQLSFLQQAAEIIEAEQGTINLQSLSARYQNDLDKRLVYEELVQLLAASNRPNDAFLYAERARARGLLDQLGNPHIGQPKDVDNESLEEEQQLREEIILLQGRLEKAHLTPIDELDPQQIDAWVVQLENFQKRYEELKIENELRHPEYFALQHISVVPLDDVQTELLDSNTTLIEYFVTREGVLAWVVDQKDATLVTLDITRRDLRSQIQSLREVIIEAKDYDSDVGGSLYQQVFAPLKPYIQHSNLLIVSHDVLHYLPFSALWNQETKRYLIEEYAIANAPSASAIKYILNKRNTNHERVLAIGNADDSLPYADKETQTIAQLYKTKPLLGKQATEDAFYRRAGRADILHFATHVQYNPINPLFTHLQLTSSSKNDGNLTVLEIYDLTLGDTNLAVLSACESALTQESYGDELIGLTQAFLSAGSPAVVTTLWSINDEASSTLMVSFYRHLQEGMGNAEALRAAQLEVMIQDKWNSPYYWAAFELTGDPIGYERR